MRFGTLTPDEADRRAFELQGRLEPSGQEIRIAAGTDSVTIGDRRVAVGAAETTYNVVGPYVEEDGRVMEGCIGTGLTRRAAEELAQRKLLERSEYLVGYSPRLFEQFRERTRVTTSACGTPTKAEGLDLTWMGGPEDMAAPGASSPSGTRFGNARSAGPSAFTT